ncbi:MAG: PAS domain-containing protein [Chloroflexi bacterium]|nr:PAS domain-containing protein [Chloroflexota bacterium]
MSLKLLALLTAVVAITATLLTVGLAWTHARQLEADAMAHGVATSRLIAAMVDESVSRTLTEVVAVGNDPRLRVEIRDGDEQAITRRLDTLMRLDPHLVGLAVTDQGGQILAAWPPSSSIRGANFADDPRARRLQEGAAWFIASPRRGLVSGLPIIPITVAVRGDHDELVGAITAGYSLDQLSAYLHDSADGTKSVVKVFDASGIIISHPDPERLLQRVADHDAVSQAALAGRATAAATFNGHGEPILAAATILPHLGWSAEVQVPTSVVFEPVRAAALQSAQLGVLVTLLVGLLASPIARLGAAPLVALQVAARHVASGEYDVPVPQLNSYDEMDDLAADFERMRAQLAERARANKSALARLAASEHEASRLAVVAARASNPVLIADAQERITWVNPAFTQTFGYHLHDVVGLNAINLLGNPAGKTHATDAIRAAAARGEGFDVEAPVYDRQGRQHWMRIDAVPVRDASNDLVHWICVQTDLSERRAAESQLRLQDAALRAAANAVVITDTQGTIRWVNPAFTTLTGYTAEEAVGQNPRVLKSGQHDRPFYDHLWSAIRRGDVWRGEVINRRKDGTTYVEEMTITPVRDEHGEIANFVAVKSDVTARRRAEQALAAANKELAAAVLRANDMTAAAESASRAKSEFLAMMSHEIRTPMNGVIGMAEILSATDLDDEQRDAVETIRTSADALLSVINDVLDFSKIEAGRLEPDLQPTNVAAVVRGVADVVRIEAQRRGLALVCEVDERLAGPVLADAGRLRQVLLNLASNAVKFTEQGSVALRASVVEETPDGLTAYIAVADTGIGISPDVLGRLFQPFTQADSSTTRRYGGTGLGLAISHRLMQLLGGRIGVESSPGEGSTFWIHIALDRVQATAPARSVAPSGGHPATVTVRLLPKDAAASPDPPRLLLAEDNPVNQKVAVRMLENLGYRVDVVADGAAAVAACTQARYAAILMDCQMPVLDGYGATRAIRESSPDNAHTPILAMTASAFDGDRERCLAAGMDDYLTKPMQQHDLADLLAHWVSTPEAAEDAAAASSC